jgi:hypothetical protein
MKYSFLALVIFLASCSGGNKDQKNTSDSNVSEGADTTVAGADSVEQISDTLIMEVDYSAKPDFSKKEMTILKKYFSDRLLSEISAYKKYFKVCEKEWQLRNVYRHTIALAGKMREELSIAQQTIYDHTDELELEEHPHMILDGIYEDFEKIKNFCPGISYTCVAECTEPWFTYNNKDLLTKAKETVGSADDEYFQLYIDFYSDEADESTTFGIIMTQTWDYGGYSNLGDGLHLKILTSIQEQKERSDLFALHLDQIAGTVYDDILSWEAFKHPIEKTVKEIEDIVQKISLEPEMKKLLEKRIKHLRKEGEELYQFGCESGDCIYG